MKNQLRTSISQEIKDQIRTLGDRLGHKMETHFSELKKMAM